LREKHLDCLLQFPGRVAFYEGDIVGETRLGLHVSNRNGPVGGVTSQVAGFGSARWHYPPGLGPVVNWAGDGRAEAWTSTLGSGCKPWASGFPWER